jgi:ElaB/YqjD/DUF883 family membrane-anchored ribosome-binding protein
MTGPTGTPPTSPAAKQDTTKSVQGSTGLATGATTDISQPAAVKATGISQSAAEKALDSTNPAPEKILETNPSATASTAPKLTSGSQIETATTLPGGTGSSPMGMGRVVEPSLPQGSRDSGSGQTASSSSSTTTTGSDTSRDQQDRGGQSEGLTETASRYSRDMGRRASEAYEQGRQGISETAGQAWDTARRTAGQVRRQSSQGLSSAQSVLTENPVVGVMVGVAVGVLVGYLIGHTTASARTAGTRRYNDRDEFADAGHYTGRYPSYGDSARGSVRYPDDDFGESGHYADPNRYSDRN